MRRKQADAFPYPFHNWSHGSSMWRRSMAAIWRGLQRCWSRSWKCLSSYSHCLTPFNFNIAPYSCRPMFVSPPNLPPGTVLKSEYI
jgi:hypothetical protein